MARRSHGNNLRGLELPASKPQKEARFGRIFDDLPEFDSPKDLLVDLAEKMNDPDSRADHPDLPAGYAYLGQFIDHDITLDTTPLAEQETDPEAEENFRSPRLDLKAIYGGGLRSHAANYDPDDPDKLRVIDREDGPLDLPRLEDGTAVIGDPRNDENLIVAQLHAAFLRFHNALVDHVRNKGADADTAFFGAAQPAGTSNGSWSTTSWPASSARTCSTNCFAKSRTDGIRCAPISTDRATPTSR